MPILLSIFNIASSAVAYDKQAAVNTVLSVVFVIGLISFTSWIIKTKAGKTALPAALPKQTNLPPYIPLLIILIWICATVAFSKAIKLFAPHFSETKNLFYSYSFVAAVELLLIILMLKAAAKTFNHRLKGLGLNYKTIVKDFFAAALNFITIWPFVISIISIIIFLGTEFFGDDFKMQQNEGLAIILEHNVLWLRLLMIGFAVLIVPVFEELLFRGLIQNLFSSFNISRWLAILITSILFSALHPPMHFPALLVLSMCIGYPYEKSGSLLRPIFIHAIFNAASITAALYLLQTSSP